LRDRKACCLFLLRQRQLKAKAQSGKRTSLAEKESIRVI
jgi:hypothetical protein